MTNLNLQPRSWYALTFLLVAVLLLTACETSSSTATPMSQPSTPRSSSPTPTLLRDPTETPASSPAATDTPTALPTPTETPASTPTATDTPTALPTPTAGHPPVDVRLQIVGQLGGQSLALAVGGDVAFLGVGPRLVALDISTPEAPRLLGHSEVLPGVVRDIALAGDVAYIAAGDAGLRIIDLSNSAMPHEIGLTPDVKNAQAVAIADSMVYVAGDELHVLNLSEATAPREIAVLGLPDRVRNLAVAAGYAYVVHDEGLLILDVSDPTSPREVASKTFFSVAEDVALGNGYAYVASGGLHVVDVADPAQPRVVSEGKKAGMPTPVLAAAGDHVYIAAAYCEFGICGSNLRVMDVSNPADPREVGSWNVSDVIADLVVTDGTAYIATWGSGLQVVDVEDPSKPSLLGVFDILGSLVNVVVSDGYAYVTDGGAKGLQVVQVEDPTTPVKVGALSELRFAVDVVLSKGYAYVPAWVEGLRVVDLSDPTQPREVGSLDGAKLGGSIARAVLEGGYLYGVSGEAGLTVIDVSDPGRPEIIGTFNAVDSAEAVAVSEAYAYLTGSNALQVIDVSNPSLPEEVGSETLPGHNLSSLVVEGRTAYVALAECMYFTCSGSLHVIDVVDPTQPQLLGSLEIPGGALGLASAEGTVYVAAGDAGVWVVDVSDPAHPGLVGSMDTPGRAQGLAVVGDIIYVADNSSGLLILQVRRERGEDDGPATISPPPATLGIDGETQISGIGTYCWTSVDESGTGGGLCADKIGIPTDPQPLSVRSPFTAKVDLHIDGSPDELSLRVFPVTEEEELPSEVGEWRWWNYGQGMDYSLALEGEPEFPLELDPGLYVLSLFARWSSFGDVVYGFLVEVVP